VNAAAALLAVLAIAAAALALFSRRELQRARIELDQLSYYDRLTGLPNRSVLHQALDELLRDARRTKARVAVISIELRSFATINETYGHEVGDELMVAVARQLRRAQRSGDRLVRYGGPQFVVLCPDISDSGRATKRAEEFLAAISPAFEIREDNIRVAANAGIVLTDQDYASADDLLLDAAVALHDAVEDGAGAVSIYDHSLRARMTPSNAEHRLRQALDDDEFTLLYLPVVSLRDGRILGVEALLRWSNPDRGLVNPADFLKALDDTGLIVPVGEHVLREAARQALAWQHEHPDRRLTTTVNLSPRQLGQADLYDKVQEILADVGVEPGRICLEITEGALVRDLESAWLMLRNAKQLGVQLALDDFGTGYSSLSYLRRFRLDALKIDRSFVRSMAQSREDEAIVAHIIGLAQALGMVPVAEGVETAEQAKRLTRLGCDAAQGFHFAEPQTAAQISELLAAEAEGASSTASA
jgi:diguanylate cyclase (GGDEF)-like protein